MSPFDEHGKVWMNGRLGLWKEPISTSPLMSSITGALYSKVFALPTLPGGRPYSAWVLKSEGRYLSLTDICLSEVHHGS